MKFNSSIYLFPLAVQFNTEEIDKFETFDTLHSSQLYSALVLNNEEIFSGFNNSNQIYFCFDEKDKEFLPNGFLQLKENLIFGNTKNHQKYLKEIFEKYIPQMDKNLFVFSNAIGFTREEIQRVFNLLAVEEETVIIGKTKNLDVAYIGFNSAKPDFLLDMDLGNLNLDKLLYKVNQNDTFVYVIGNYLLIKNITDFKNLYVELSKKESLSYCSHKMHELFTNLFIEYKEILK